MFGKLLKHEFKTSAPLMLLISAIALVFGCVGACAIRLLNANPDAFLGDSESGAWIMILFMLLLTITYIGLFVYGFASQYIPLFRFYSSRFTDRGYLTFTLPVSVRCNFLSAAVNMLIWHVITVCVLLVAFLLIFSALPSEAFTAPVNPPLETSTVPWGMLMTILFAALVSPVYYIAMNMTAVVTACSIFKRMRVLACIGFLYAFQMVSSTLISAIMLICMMPAMISNHDPLPAMTAGYGIAGVIMLLLSVGGYFLSVHLMEKKLNLA